jgi:hypothetical protein
MATIEKNRVIRPSTRKASSRYRVHCDKVGAADTLRINITHESDPSVHFNYEVEGREIANLNSLHFDATFVNGRWQITWQQKVNIRRIQ